MNKSQSAPEINLRDYWKAKEKGDCHTCGLKVTGVYDIPKLPGLYCSIECAESFAFGQDHCRWCGTPLEDAYTSINSRLCSDDCQGNYKAYVVPDKLILGARSAKVGTGVRLRYYLANPKLPPKKRNSKPRDPGK